VREVDQYKTAFQHGVYAVYLPYGDSQLGILTTNLLILLALPREVREANNSNWLQNGLGKKGVIEFQDISEGPPKPSLAAGGR
jgi:hypothetical protein